LKKAMDVAKEQLLIQHLTFKLLTQIPSYKCEILYAPSGCPIRRVVEC
jgi:hypothetical protein